MASDLRKESFRKNVSNLYRKSELGYQLVRPFYKIYESILKVIPDEVIVKSSFKKHMGYELDLNNPETLNEKINWLKLYNKEDIHTLIADKYRVRSYITEKIGAQFLIPLLYHTDNSDDIIPENLPNSEFIIKTNHDSSGGIIVRDKTAVDWPKTRKRFKKLLKENNFYSTREWQYKNIVPHLVVEKLLTNEDGSIPDDYKLHCFNGKVQFIGVDLDRHKENRARNLYDINWNLMSCNWGRPNGKNLPKPSNFDEMIKLAEKLAEGFIYLRVDFYSVEGKTYFGELTLHQSSGFRKFWQHECDEKLGKLLDISALKNKHKKS